MTGDKKPIKLDLGSGGAPEAVSALAALRLIPSDRAVPLLYVYHHGNKQVRPLALEQLRDIADLSLIDEIEHILGSPDERCAVIASDCLGKLATERCRVLIKLRLYDKRGPISKRARRWWLGTWGLALPGDL